jgi:hypothetical protein
MAAAKKNEQQQMIVLVVLVFVLGFVFKDKIFGKASTNKANVRGGSGAPPPGAPAVPGGAADAGPSAPTVTPAQIPVLTPEIKRKIKERKGSSIDFYAKEKLESGANPFISYTVDVDALERARDLSPGPTASSAKSKKKVAFTRKLTFWGAFLPGPDEPKRVIIEVGGDPQPWTGAVGEMIDGTPYRVDKLANGDLEVILVNPTNPSEKPVHLLFEGSKDDPSRARQSNKDVDDLFGARAPADPASPAADPAGGGSLEPAFDR